MGSGEERVRWTTVEGHPGIELLWAEHSSQLWRWFHETYTVCTLLSAPSDWTYRNKPLHTRDGELMMMEPGEVHITRKLLAGDSTFRVALFSSEVVHRAAAELGRPAPHVAGHCANPSVFDAFTQLHLAVERSETPLEQDARVAVCLERFITRCCERPVESRVGRERAAVRKAKAFLREHYTETTRLHELAREAGLSRFHFLRSFSSEVGIPPHAYVLQLRIARARELLRTGMPAVEVAVSLGFADQSHFARHFRRICGVSPGSYQRQMSSTPITSSS